MRSGRVFFLLIIALILGGGAAWVANKWVLQRTVPDVMANTGEAVVAAAIRIPFGQKIEPEHLKTVSMPSGAVPDGAFHDIQSVVGQIAKQDLVPGEVVLESRIAPHIAGSTLAAVVNPSMRAVTLRVNDVIGVAGFLLPGNHVDILATRKPKSGSDATTRTLLQNIKVLAVDQTANPEKNEPVIVRAVTMEMTPQQSEVLVNARSEGSIQLTLRNPLDDERVQAALAEAANDIEEVVAAPPPPEPEAPKKAVVKRTSTSAPTVTIIRGTKVDKTKVKI